MAKVLKENQMRVSSNRVAVAKPLFYEMRKGKDTVSVYASVGTPKSQDRLHLSFFSDVGNRTDPFVDSVTSKNQVSFPNAKLSTSREGLYECTIEDGRIIARKIDED